MVTDSILQVLLTSDQPTLTRCHSPNARAAMEAPTEKRLQAGIGQLTGGFFCWVLSNVPNHAARGQDSCLHRFSSHHLAT